MGVHFHSQFRNPLAYPAGYAPGFDPSHPAAVSLVFSSVAQNLNHIDVRLGRRGVITGSPVANIDANMGPVLNFNDTSGNSVAFPNNPTDAPVSGTWGAILKPTSSTAGYSYIFSYGVSTGQGSYVLVQADLFKHHNQSGTIVSSGITLEVGVPYFLALSYSPGLNVSDFYVKNLRTGKLLTASAAAGSAVSGSVSGNIWVGSNERDSGPAGRTAFAAAMFSRAYTPPSAMIQWAADPWSFWYPNPGDNWIAAQAASGLFKITGNPRSLAGFGGGLAA